MTFIFAQTNTPNAQPSPDPESKSFFDIIKDLLNFAKSKPAEKINKQAEDRYHGLIPKEELQDKITPGERAALMKQLGEGKEMDLNSIRADGTGAKIDNQLNALKGVGDRVATIGGDNLDSGGNSAMTLNSPFIIGGGLVGLLVLMWWIQSLDVWVNLREKVAGDDGIYYQILEAIGKAKPKVSESDLFLYNKALVDIEKEAKKVISIDNDKFSGTEFLIFAKIRYSFNNNVGSYEGLKPYLNCLRSAVKAQSSYMLLAQVESSCRGTKQQQFYDFCHQLLQENVSGKELTRQVREKLEEVLTTAKTDVGKANLESYAAEIESLATDPKAIAIMNRFKGEQEGDCATMKTVMDIVGSFKGEEVSDLRTVMYTTMNYYDDFEHLADIIDMPEEKRSPDTFARLLQYLTMEQRHQWAFMQFQNLVEALRKWHKPFRLLVTIRKKYPAEEFRRPAIFKEPIAGLSVYEKYKNSLTDQRTGHSFIAFEEEEGNDEEFLEQFTAEAQSS